MTKDQLGALATSITSVDVQSEDWRSSGEVVSVVIPIRAIIDTSNLKDKIARIQEDDSTESIREAQNKLANLQKELEQLKTAQQKQDPAEKKDQPTKPAAETNPELKLQAGAESKDQPVKEQQAATSAVKPADQPQAAVEQKAVAEPPAPKQNVEALEVKKTISNEEKQKYENVLKNVFVLDCLEKGNIALGDRRWNDAQYVFSKAIELSPDLAEAYTGKSCALQNLNQPMRLSGR